MDRLYGCSIVRPESVVRFVPAPFSERLRAWCWRRLDDATQITLLTILFLALSLVFGR